MIHLGQLSWYMSLTSTTHVITNQTETAIMNSLTSKKRCVNKTPCKRFFFLVCAVHQSVYLLSICKRWLCNQWQNKANQQREHPISQLQMEQTNKKKKCRMLETTHSMCRNLAKYHIPSIRSRLCFNFGMGSCQAHQNYSIFGQIHSDAYVSCVCSQNKNALPRNDYVDRISISVCSFRQYNSHLLSQDVRSARLARCDSYRFLIISNK